jgi:hypothetical protein
MKMITLLALVLFVSCSSAPQLTTAASAIDESKTDKPVHLFILSGQSNMKGMKPETGFLPEANKLFKDDKVVYVKVSKGGQPIRRWLKEWADIAKEKGINAKHRERILKGQGVLFYQPILDQYKEMLKKYPKPTSVTFCWMQGERDANGGVDAAYKDALKLLIAKLRRDLKRPDMNIVIGRIGEIMPWTDLRAWQYGKHNVKLPKKILEAPGSTLMI